MTTITPEELRARIEAKLMYAVGRDLAHAHDHDWYMATALAVRDYAVDRWFATSRAAEATGRKRVYYLSLEFLIGRLLSEYLGNLQLHDVCREALAGLDVDLDRIRELEPDAALGNGGLGRLAACFMESMATVGVAGFGYGIRYQHGLFRQLFNDGWQVEQPEDWLSFGNPWEFERPEICYEIDFGGTVEVLNGGDGGARHIWRAGGRVSAVAYDTPIVGWPGNNVNTLRLWSARSANPMRLEQFNRGDYLGAVAEQVTSESIVRVLYPNDDTAAGQELRLKQEYFFTSASLQDILRRHLQQNGDLGSLPQLAAIQLNDTHPAIGIAEMMRLLVDRHGVGWSKAWRITQGCFAYTNHTLLPEALECWPVALMERLLPRHMQIIRRLNDELMQQLEGTDVDREAVALIDHGYGHRVRMGNLAFFGAHKVNGVSALHTELMKQTVFRDLHRAFPDRIVNQTNGITARRWLQPVQPGARRADHRRDRRLLAGRSRAPAGAQPARRGQRLSRLLRGRQARQQAAPRRADRAAQRHRGRPRRAVRRPHQADSRVQAPAPQHPRDRRALAGDPRRAASRLGAAGQDLRRQGGGVVPAGQADHQADQRRRARREPGSAGRATGSRWCSCPTTTSARASASSPRPISRSRSRPPAWRRPAPAT